jgi:CubicO group peptidase (beta-lactamase class C family)
LTGISYDNPVLLKKLPDHKDLYMHTPIETLVQVIAESPLNFQPGTQFLYGLNHEVLGYIIEIITGMKLNEFLKEEIFDPLGMKDTDFYVPSGKCSYK